MVNVQTFLEKEPEGKLLRGFIVIVIALFALSYIAGFYGLSLEWFNLRNTAFLVLALVITIAGAFALKAAIVVLFYSRSVRSISVIKSELIVIVIGFAGIMIIASGWLAPIGLTIIPP